MSVHPAQSQTQCLSYALITVKTQTRWRKQKGKSCSCFSHWKRVCTALDCKAMRLYAPVTKCRIKKETSPLLYQLRRIYSTGCLQPWSPALGNLQMTGVFHSPTKLIWLLIFQAGNLGYFCKYLSGMVRRIMSPHLGIWKFGSCTSQISMCGESLETMLIIARGLF